MSELRPIPFEVIGASPKRANERDRDRAAIELASYVIGLLKFDGAEVAYHRDELLKRANKVRRSQGNGDVVFVSETAATLQAAVEPDAKRAFEATEARLALLMGES